MAMSEPSEQHDAEIGAAEAPRAPAHLPVVDAYGLPRPTPWPAVLASGVALMVWGFFIGQIVAATGLFLIAAALVGWIRELRQQALAEQRRQQNDEERTDQR
jgi:hypothetical protein